MTQRNIAAWLAQWLAQSPAQSVEDWHNRQRWLAPVPFHGYPAERVALEWGEGVLLTL